MVALFWALEARKKYFPLYKRTSPIALIYGIWVRVPGNIFALVEANCSKRCVNYLCAYFSNDYLRIGKGRR
jgi:hypothetical protein